MDYTQRREAADGQRLSLLHPRFNLREIAKQMILLEDHLTHPYKHCPDCIRKHLLTIEAFAEEAVALDTVGIYRHLAGRIAESARHWMEDFSDDRPLPDIGQDVRKMRKNLVPLVCDPRDLATRVAARYLATTRVCLHRRIKPSG